MKKIILSIYLTTLCYFSFSQNLEFEKAYKYLITNIYNDTTFQKTGNLLPYPGEVKNNNKHNIIYIKSTTRHSNFNRMTDLDKNSKILFDTNNEIKCLNSFENEDTLETQFAQSLLNGPPSHDDKTSEKVNASILGQRIFSLSHMNKTPELNEFNLELRKPQTSRVDKTIEN